MKEYRDLFQHDKYVRASALYNMITIFDSLRYERNDYDVLSAPQRNYVGAVLEKNGHRHVTGNSFKNLKTGQTLRFIITKTLGVSPLNELNYQYNDQDIFIVTPGTYFLFLVEKLSTDDKQDSVRAELMDLVSHHPVNLEQLLDLSTHDHFYATLKEVFKECKAKQDDAIENYLKGKRPLGSLF